MLSISIPIDNFCENCGAMDILLSTQVCADGYWDHHHQEDIDSCSKCESGECKVYSLLRKQSKMQPIPVATRRAIMCSIAPYTIQPFIDAHFERCAPTTVEEFFVALKSINIHKEEKRYAALRLIGNMAGERVGPFLELEKIANRVGLQTRVE